MSNAMGAAKQASSASRRLTSPTGKTIRLAPIHPNEGTRAEYQRRLERLIDEMSASVSYWLTAAYRANEPATMAQDAPMAFDESSARALNNVMQRLARRWNKRFAEMGPELARYFATAAVDRADGALKAALKRGGITVEFKLTAAANDVLQSTVEQNVSLIRSISSEYLSDIKEMVMRSVAKGRDIGGLTKQLHDRYGITRRRAARIARTANNQATADIVEVRQASLGITKAIWRHSGGGKHPRPRHLAADGQEYDVGVGLPIGDKGQNVRPGEEIECFPADMKVGLETGPMILWRSFFNGPMVHIRIGTDLLKGTPNHPVLTARGWVPLGELNCGDKIVCMIRQCGGVVDHCENDRKTTIGDLFETCARESGYVSRDRGSFHFYGDRPHGNVDEVVVVDNQLRTNQKAGRRQNFSNFPLTETDGMIALVGNGAVDHVIHPNGSSFNEISSFRFNGLASGAGEICVGPTAHNPAPDHQVSNVACAVPREAEHGGDRCAAETALIKRDDFVSARFPVNASIDPDTERLDLFAEFVGIAANLGSSVFEFGAGLYEFRSVSDKSVRDFSGHVFTMQTRKGHYSISDARVQAKNCRCVSISIIEALR